MIRAIERMENLWNLCKTNLVEQAAESLIARLLSLRVCLLFFLRSFVLGSFGGRGGRSRRSVRIGVSDAVLQFLYLRPAVLGLNGNSQDLLVAVDY